MYEAFNVSTSDSLFLAVVLRQSRETSEELLAGVHRVGEDHQETTNDGQVTEEEIEVEDETVTECLDDDNSEQTADRVLGVFPRNDGA